MRDLVERCRREQIPLVLVLMPESSDFRTWYSPEGLAEARRLLAELRDGCGVPVIDASAWVPDDGFKDGHHLMEKGAEVFTTRLREELRPFLARGEDANER
jgi:hypothetical protein